MMPWQWLQAGLPGVCHDINAPPRAAACFRFPGDALPAPCFPEQRAPPPGGAARCQLDARAMAVLAAGWGPACQGRVLRMLGQPPAPG